MEHLEVSPEGMASVVLTKEVLNVPASHLLDQLASVVSVPGTA